MSLYSLYLVSLVKRLMVIGSAIYRQR
jgi:hypothetical protein